MDIKLHNTLTGEKEVFKPLVPGHVSMYNCGPTVYHFAHIGNLRSYIFADTLRRMFEWNGLEVKQVINITDVGHLVSDSDDGEDKMEKGAKREGKSAHDIAEFYTSAFYTDLDRLNIDRSRISFPKATDYIAEQIDMIHTLEEKGFTYKTNDGIYFDTSKFPEYGKLGNIDLSGIEEGARIGVNAEKKHATDFALWKLSPTHEKREIEWPSPWGVGFPGWHIECSAMSRTLLGETFDVHTGGIDHIPVHHNNEIAQSVCANGKPFVRYWMHNGFLTVDSGKMAKSEENFIRLDTLIERGVHPLAYRYFVLGAHYTTLLNFTWDGVMGAQTAWQRLRAFVSQEGFSDEITSFISEQIIEKIKTYKHTFTECINDDLNTPKALALMWEVLKDSELRSTDKRELILDFDRVLGLDLRGLISPFERTSHIEIPVEIQNLITERDLARADKNFTESDRIRTQIESLGFDVLDTPEGTKIQKK